ncbi:MAG: hypothetical protein K2M42_05890 [Oscillospiraceae bacterium]|nr:hypothetical protein [Oscillospiraceae bacterium]
MPKFYFTYGQNPVFPFMDGWTEVEAPDIHAAAAIFKAAHPNRPDTPDLINCASIYSQEEFMHTEMANSDGNFGGFCHERLSLNQEVLHAKSNSEKTGKFVITCSTKQTVAGADMDVTMEGNINPIALAVLIQNIIHMGSEKCGAPFDIILKKILTAPICNGQSPAAPSKGGCHAYQD